MNAVLIAAVAGIISGDSLFVRVHQDTYMLHLEQVAAPVKGQKYSKDAEQALAKICFNKQAIVTYNQDQSNRRVLKGNLKCDGKDVSVELIRKGYAWVRPQINNPELIAFQDNAKTKKMGLWQETQPIPPWQWSPPQSSITNTSHSKK